MAFQAAGAMIELCILAVLSKEDMYGYALTSKVGIPLHLSESTLYPVLRRLKKEGYLTVYDQNYDGRNRRYYSLSSSGKIYYENLLKDWELFIQTMEQIIKDQNKSSISKSGGNADE